MPKSVSDILSRKSMSVPDSGSGKVCVAYPWYARDAASSARRNSKRYGLRIVFYAEPDYSSEENIAYQSRRYTAGRGPFFETMRINATFIQGNDVSIAVLPDNTDIGYYCESGSLVYRHLKRNRAPHEY